MMLLKSTVAYHTESIKVHLNCKKYDPIVFKFLHFVANISHYLHVLDSNRIKFHDTILANITVIFISKHTCII